MEDMPHAPLYTLAELYGMARNIIWKGSPDNKTSCRGYENQRLRYRALMRRRVHLEVIGACLLLLLVGCGDKAKDLYGTAELEEKQNNRSHATKLYRQIVEEYSNSPYANQAKSPELVADRIITFGKIVGRENVSDLPL